jgi:hypothetical protein
LDHLSFLACVAGDCRADVLLASSVKVCRRPGGVARFDTASCILGLLSR